jgi:putative peptide zinc metalloprotease protein
MPGKEEGGMQTSGKPQLGAGEQVVPLPPVREDLRLYPGPPQRDGSPTWRILDPVRNSFFEIGWLEFELLARWKEHKDAASLAARVAAETPISPSLEEVREMIGFLTSNQLLAARSKEARDALSRRMKDAKQPWYTELFHHYLFFRLPLFHPDAFLARTVGLVDVFFTRGFVLLVLVLLGIDLYLLSREWYSVTDAAARMFTPSAFLYYAIAVTFSKVIHELAHAFAARRYGVRVPTIGLAFLVMWPYLYTDTGETWKLGDRRKQLVIACAGMSAELVLAVFSTLLWALAPEGGAKNVFFVLASTTWVMTLAINLSPFMRFDGYFVLSDLLDFPNLHERGTACGKWWMRRTFFGLDEAMPEPQLLPRQRAALITFAYITWIYRLVVFLGIAVLVYHFFFKLLGIVMFALELFWFVFRPIWKEMGYLWQARKAVRLPWRPAAAVLAFAGVAVWMIPVSHEVTAPAILRAQHEHAVYAPFSGRITDVRVADMQKVAAGAELLRIEASELGVREKKADIGIASARAELARMPANVQLQENFRVLQQRLGQAVAEKQAVAEEFSRQQLRSAQDGTIRDMAPDLIAGRWVNTQQLLMRVVSQSEPVIEAYVTEQQVAAISPGQTVRFFPRLADRPVLEGKVLAVDRAPQKELQRPLLASIYGGDVVVKQGQRGALVAQDAVYRVMVKPLGNVQKADAVIAGRVRIETSLRFLAENFAYRIISIFIRESGI